MPNPFARKLPLGTKLTNVSLVLVNNLTITCNLVCNRVYLSVYAFNDVSRHTSISPRHGASLYLLSPLWPCFLDSRAKPPRDGLGGPCADRQAPRDKITGCCALLCPREGPARRGACPRVDFIARPPLVRGQPRPIASISGPEHGGADAGTHHERRC
jgi:hypothetical protein